MKHLFLIILALFLVTAPAGAQEEEMTTLKASVTDAVRQHPQIKSLLYNREAVANNLRAALGRFFPSLGLSMDYGLQQYNNSTARENETNDRVRTANDTTLSLSQNIFDGMNRWNDYEGSKLRLESAEWRLIDNVESVGLDAVRAHVDVVRERKLVALAGENITAHQEVLASIVERVEGGAGSKADEMQARGRVARAETTLITYLGNMRTAEAEYFRVTGKHPGPLEEAEYDYELVPESMEAFIDQAVESNPKVKIFQTELEVSKKDKGVTESVMLPTVDLEMQTRSTNNLDGSDTFLQDHRAMLALNWNLFNGGIDTHDILAAKARISEADANLKDTSDDIIRQAATAWSEHETSLNAIDKHMEALQYSMESRDMYMMQFNVGQRSLLDVLDSINEVFSNSVLLETSQSNLTFSLYKFFALEGNLINSLEVDKKNYDRPVDME